MAENQLHAAIILPLNIAVKAAGAARVAGCSVALNHHAHQHRVLIAVHAQFYHLLKFTGTLALLPKAVARAAPIMGNSRFNGEGERLFIHPSKHQHFTRARILCNGSNKPALIKARA